jgi:uncharacterized protein YecE (DUF72 family)
MTCVGWAPSDEVALCLHDLRRSAMRRERAGPFVYVRFHGATSKCGYFNNDIGGHAPRDAVTLRRVLEAPA